MDKVLDLILELLGCDVSLASLHTKGFVGGREPNGLDDVLELLQDAVEMQAVGFRYRLGQGYEAYRRYGNCCAIRSGFRDQY